MGLPGWLVLINLIPGIGTGVTFLVLTFVPGNPGTNKYGEVAAAVTVDDVANLEKEKLNNDI